jgi:hypothetical protein
MKKINIYLLNDVINFCLCEHVAGHGLFDG